MKYFLIDLKKAENEFSAILVKTSSKAKLCTNKRVKKIRKLSSEDIILDNQRVVSVSKIELPFKVKNINSKTGIKIPSVYDLKFRLDAMYPTEPWNIDQSTDLLKKYFVASLNKEFLGIRITTEFNQEVYFSGSLATEDYMYPWLSKKDLQKEIASLKTVYLI